MSDEHAPQVMGCMGDPLAHTPHLDRLAASGVLFENAYCSNPICVPGRYSVLTGKYPRDIGSLHFHQGLDPSALTYPRHFAHHGYQTTCVGKMHFQGLEQMHGWMFRPYGDMEVFGHRKLPGFDHDPFAHESAERRSLADWVRESRAGMDGFILFDESVTREARVHLLDYFRATILPRSAAERPLLFQVSWKTPHWPFIAPPEYFRHYRDRITLPDIGPPAPGTEHPFMTLKNQKELPFRNSDEETLTARAAYWGLVQYVDRQVGLVLDVLEELALLDQFLIAYHADHGEMAGNHGAWGKGCMYEHAARVPLILSYPGHIPANLRIKNNVSLVDVFPTLCDYAELPIPPDLRGETLRSLLDGESVDANDRAVIAEFYYAQDKPPAVMAKRGSAKLIDYGSKFPPQLFDLDKDPFELTDLAGDLSYASVQADLQCTINALPRPFMWNEL